LLELRDFDANRTPTVRVSDRIGLLRHLQTFWLQITKLQAFPDALVDCPVLRTLVITHGSFASLPVEFGNLHQLRFVMLDGNELTDLPDVFDQLPNLSSLSILGNRLPMLPPSMRSLINLKTLNWKGTGCQSRPKFWRQNLLIF
jgi:Leucine-rich repeat (LRR) protein